MLSQLSYTPVFLRFLFFPFRDVGPYLSFRHVSVQVLSARHSLTSVFGMGTGGPCALTGPTIECFLFGFPCRPLKIEQQATYGISVSLLYHFLHRKEVIQPHLPIRLPCYDLTPIIEPTFDSCLLAVSSLASGVPNFHGLTGGVYKARERIHRGMLIRDY